MTDRVTVMWFVRGFLIMSALVLGAAVLFSPYLGLAQGGGNADSAPVVDGVGSQRYTDDPQGRVSIPLAETAAEIPNEELETEGEMVVGSDDPRDRGAMPAPPDNASPASNENAGGSGGDSAVAAEIEAEIGAQAYGSPLVIPGADFRADWDQRTFFFSFGGGYRRGGLDCSMAPAYLPDGATVTWMYASVYDNDADDHAWFNLYRVDNYDGSTDVMADVETTDAFVSTDIQNLVDSSINNPVVAYPEYSYYVVGCLESSNTRIYSVRLYYTD